MKLRSFWHFGPITYFLMDYVLLWGAVICAMKLSPSFQYKILDGIVLRPGLRFIGYGMPLAISFGLQLVGIQQSQSGFRPGQTLVRTSVGVVSGMLVFLLVNVFVEFQLIGRFVLGFTFVYGTAFVLGSRLFVWKLAEHTSRNLLVYGGSRAYGILEEAVRITRQPVRLCGYTHGGAEAGESAGFVSVGELGLYGYCEKHSVEAIVVELSDQLQPAEREALLLCTGQGIRVLELGHFFEARLERVYAPGLRESWFWSYDPAFTHPVFFALKRAADILLSLLGMIVFAPFAPLVILAIKLQDRGNVIYSQVRVGLYNQPFRIYKFRTMRVDAERDGAQWAKQNDDRTTPLGRFLRKTRIDEVPQFWNIMAGDMSFVGPRPERPNFVDLIERDVPFYRYRHLIKPGLSGWAQINYPYGASIDDAREKLAFDLYYLKYASITLDWLITVRTVAAMVKGAR
jgi:exopolysaccharide biosynthesis polyprenyl glycosylphosphotransferase